MKTTGICANCKKTFRYVFRKSPRKYCSHSCTSLASYYRVRIQRRAWRENQRKMLTAAGLPIPKGLEKKRDE